MMPNIHGLSSVAIEFENERRGDSSQFIMSILVHDWRKSTIQLQSGIIEVTNANSDVAKTVKQHHYYFNVATGIDWREKK